MAKRSPILGYNHNVRYRGLVFHVQTEDSGVLSPHLFTHLFHEGVIVSTRKLVYDAGASPEAIKALMQAQHKAVLKDLNKGVFDLKIDQYLGGTPGLEPRSASSTAAAAAAEAPAVEAPAAEAPAAEPPAVESAAPAAAAGANGVSDDHDEAAKTRRRVPRDTMVDEKPAPKSDAAKVIDAASASRPGPPAPPRPTPATLPPLQKPSRPTITSVVGRPTAPAARRADSDAAEIYAPAPPMEPTISEPVRAAGSLGAQRISSPAISPPASNPSTVRGIEPAPNRPGTPPPVGQRSPKVTPPIAMPRTATLPSRSSLSQPPPTPPMAKGMAPARPTPTPATAPARPTPTPAPARTAAAGPVAGGNVVMTRPAVIVGAPPSSVPSRARVVAEDPGRPFGQALISEKSLDEVIHAYLSEDGDEP